ncbi:MAG: hypothetical protein AAGD07_09270 [Planctomycetota bacterium]
MNKLWTILLAAVLVSTSAELSHGQSPVLGPTGGYTRTPTLSPYLDLLRFNGGVLPNYQQFVRPRLELNRTLQSQARQIDRQNRALYQLNRQISRPTAQGTETGVRSGFLQYSTYYPALQR